MRSVAREMPGGSNESSPMGADAYRLNDVQIGGIDDRHASTTRDAHPHRESAAVRREAAGEERVRGRVRNRDSPMPDDVGDRDAALRLRVAREGVRDMCRIGGDDRRVRCQDRRRGTDIRTRLPDDETARDRITQQDSGLQLRERLNKYFRKKPAPGDGK